MAQEASGGTIALARRHHSLMQIFCTKINKRSAAAEMAAQCCASQFLLADGVPLFNALFLSNLGEYHH